MINKSKKIYLETSAIRLLGIRLEHLLIKASCFTSTLTLLELMTDLENEFAVRKNCVKNILSFLDIDWQFPEDVVASAFSLLKRNEYRIFDFQLLCNMLASSDSFEDFKLNSSGLNLKYSLDYFTEADKYYSDNFKQATNLLNRNISALLTKDKDSRTIHLKEPLEVKKRKDYLDIHFRGRDYNEGFTILALCENYVLNLLGINDETKVDELYNSYNGKIKYYVQAFSYYSILKTAKGNDSGRNDMTDLEHFLYLRNSDDIKICSNDKLIQRICKELFPDRYINPEELLQMMKS